MSNNIDQAFEQIKQVIKNIGSDVSLNYARRLLSLIRAQVPVMNMELASSYKDKGYDFKTIPDAFLANATITESTRDDGMRIYSVYIPASSFTGASETLVEFFKQYVVGNAVHLLNNLDNEE